MIKALQTFFETRCRLGLLRFYQGRGISCNWNLSTMSRMICWCSGLLMTLLVSAGPLYSSLASDKDLATLEALKEDWPKVGSLTTSILFWMLNFQSKNAASTSFRSHNLWNHLCVDTIIQIFYFTSLVDYLSILFIRNIHVQFTYLYTCT